MKKIDKIDGCHHCPLKDRIYTPFVKYFCRHEHTDGMNVTVSVMSEKINQCCPLPDDTP